MTLCCHRAQWIRGPPGRAHWHTLIVDRAGHKLALDNLADLARFDGIVHHNGGVEGKCGKQP